MGQYKVQMISGVSGPLNPAYMDFNVRVASSSQQQSQILAYTALCLGIFSEEAVVISGMDYRATAGSGPYSPVTFPATEYAATRTAANTAIGTALIKPMTAYSSNNMGPVSASSSGRGDSVCVNTRATSGGKHGRGRHFVPFANRDTVLTNGLLNAAATTVLEAGYRLLLQGIGASAPIVDTDPAVWSPTTTTNYGVSYVQVNLIPSRLRSRTK